MEDEKQETKMRRSARENTSSNLRRTERSLGEYPGQSANVVFVSVGKDDGADLIAIFQQVADVGDDNVNPEQLGFRKHEPGVNDDNIVAPTHRHAVHAKFAQSAERNDMEFAGG